LTLVSVGYLIFDRVYETSATVSSAVSDPRQPFYFPFSITNNSHILTLRNIEWSCHVISVKLDVPINIENNTLNFGGIRNELRPGEVLNVPCRFMRTNNRVISADVLICMRYNVRIYYFFRKFFEWERRPNPNPTQFTWAGDATNPQWVRGPFAGSTEAATFNCEAH
jgi:hypothetical protein